MLKLQIIFKLLADMNVDHKVSSETTGTHRGGLTAVSSLMQDDARQLADFSLIRLHLVSSDRQNPPP